MGALWFCLSFGGIAIIMLFCLAAQYDRLNDLEDQLSCERKEADDAKKALNRYKICATMNSELYKTDIDSMRKQIREFEAHVDRLELALVAKNQEIIKLKANGGKNNNG